MVHGGNARYRAGMQGTRWECAVQGGNAWYTVGGDTDKNLGQNMAGDKTVTTCVCVHKGDGRLSEGRGPLLSFHMLSDSSFIKLQ